MNRFLTMAQCRDLLGMQGRSNRLVQRRLKAIAEERADASFALVKLGRSWHVTWEDLHRLMPELLPDSDELAEVVQEVRLVRRKLEQLENKLFVALTQRKAA